MFLHILMAAALVVMATPVQSGSLDSTLTPGAKGHIVVEQALTVIKTACVFADDKLFMRRLAYVESFDGVNPDANRTGYHGGIWQVDQFMFNKLKDPSSQQVLSRYIRMISASFGIDWASTTWENCRKPLYSALAARLYIQLAIDPIRVTFPRDIPDQGTFWTTYYNGIDANIFINKTKTLNTGCKSYGVDLVFVLDGSGSVGSSNFAKMKIFVTGVVAAFEVGMSKTQVAVVTYSSSVNINFYLNRHTTKPQVQAAVRNIRYTGGGTNTHLALDELLTMFTTVKGARSLAAGVPRVAIFLTDGRSNSQSQTLLSAKKVHDADITMFSIGVGSNTRNTELKAIASKPECLYLFMLEGFNEVDSLKYAIEKGACDAPLIASSGDNGTKIETKVSSEGQNCKVKVDPIGTTIQIIAKNRTVLFFVSNITFPSEAFYDTVVYAVPKKPGVIYLELSTANGFVYCNIKAHSDNKTYGESDVEVGIIPGDKDHCKDVVCQGGRTCVDDLKSNSSCVCVPGYKPTPCNEVELFSCLTKSPCTSENIAAGKFYFAHNNPNMYVQCDQSGNCFDRTCANGTKWKQLYQTCIHN